MNDAKHTLPIGAKIILLEGPDVFDGVESGLTGEVLGHTFDDGVPTYQVRFENGVEEKHIYPYEIEVES